MKKGDDATNNLHNFLSKKTICRKFIHNSFRNNEPDYLFITEKTLKPIMNLHPFFVVDNPHTLKKLKSFRI